MKLQRTAWAMASLAGLLLLGCSNGRHIGGTGVTATGHAQWVGGPYGAPEEPASGVSYKVLANGSEVEEGVTDPQGDFQLAVPNGAYLVTFEVGRGCPDLKFSIPTHEPLEVTCMRE